jgi:hypothetical protein
VYVLQKTWPVVLDLSLNLKIARLLGDHRRMKEFLVSAALMLSSVMAFHPGEEAQAAAAPEPVEGPGASEDGGVADRPDAALRP